MSSFLDSIWQYGERPALIESNKERSVHSYNDIKQQVETFESLLSQSSVMACLICKNSRISLVGYLAFITNGIVPLLLSPKTSTLYLDYYASIYRPTYLFLDFKFDRETYMEIGRFEDFYLYILKDQSNLKRTHPSLRLLLTTSGSTGSPKLVRISDENLKINSNMIISSLPMVSSDVTITTLPFNYSYGLSIINTHLLLGATIQLNEYSVMQRAFWELLIDSKATTFGGVPFLYKQIEQVGLKKIKHSSLRYLTQAGGRLGEPTLGNVYKFCSDNQIQFYVMYGQTEATARMSILHPFEAHGHRGSIGKAIAPGAFVLSPDTENCFPFDREVGELIFLGDNVAMGYAQSESDLSLGNVWNGVLKTGDLAYLDEEGYPYIVGRLSRFSKVRGIRFSLDDLEDIFLRQQIQIFALEISEKVHLVSTENLNYEVIDKILKHDAGLSISDCVITVFETIPLTSSGKVDYQAIAKQLNTQRSNSR